MKIVFVQKKSGSKSKKQPKEFDMNKLRLIFASLIPVFSCWNYFY